MLELPKAGFKKVWFFVKALALPVLLAMFPTLYHYGNNAGLLTLSSLRDMLVLNVLLAVFLYFIFLLFHRFRPIPSANATFVFLIFFNTYGLVYRYLFGLDVIPIRHYNLLALILVISGYCIWLVNKVKLSVSVSIWKYLTLISAVLLGINVAVIFPAELGKWENVVAAANLEDQRVFSESNEYPDIYYIVLDEFVGFQAMREYWNYDGVDDLVRYLEDKGFFVAESSHSSSLGTLHQMAIRLNYQEYPLGAEYRQTYFNDTVDNRVMRYLKARGYTTVVFDETALAYPAFEPIIADYVYEYGSSSASNSATGAYGLYFDEFGELVMDNTMFYIVAEQYKQNSPTVSQHSKMIYFVVENVASKDVPSPKFVYVHLLLPHNPFMFDQDGNITNQEKFINWNYYIDTYIYSIKVAEKMINNILSAASPDKPPIIIIQSDHGARNTDYKGGAILENFPAEFKTLILNALYIPGYDYSNLSQDLDPINTFPIVFNYLFDANINLFE